MPRKNPMSLLSLVKVYDFTRVIVDTFSSLLKLVILDSGNSSGVDVGGNFQELWKIDSCES